jgi:hypothetical protein
MVLAGLSSGLACLFHPAGVTILVALGLHLLLKGGLKALGRPETYLFGAAAAAPFLPWLIYILRAPHIFAVQFGGQLARKSAGTGLALERGTVLAWLRYPVLNPALVPGEGSEAGDFIMSLTFLVALVYLVLPARGKKEAGVVGLWMLAGYALNLFSREVWYPIYFFVPLTLLLAWGLAKTTFPWARTLGTVTLLLGLAWQLTRLPVFFASRYGDWPAYKKYTAALAGRLPAGSRVLLMAWPDPYFGLEEENKNYRLYEFVPEGIPVDPVLAEKALASMDYIVDSGCCNPAYVRSYLKTHGTFEGVMPSSLGLGYPVRILKLAGRTPVTPSKP